MRLDGSTKPEQRQVRQNNPATAHELCCSHVACVSCAQTAACGPVFNASDHEHMQPLQLSTCWMFHALTYACLTARLCR
jgi:hypothetical protein